MTETSSTNQAAPPKKSPIAIYVICVIIGLAVGIGGTLLVCGPRADDAVVAEYGGVKVKASEALSNVKARIFDLEEEMYRIKKQAIQGFIEDKLLEKELKKQNLTSVEQLLDKEVGADVGEVGDEEVKFFLSSKGLSLDDPRIQKDDVKDYLKYRKKFEKRRGYVESLMKKEDVKILLTAPEAPVIKVDTLGYPSWGNPKAPVTIVEFSDYQCPFCSRAIPTLNQIKKEYGQDKVRLVFRDMPLPSHNRAVPAALAAHCANDQGKFWEMHDLLFEKQTALEDENLKEYAKELKLDEAKFNECFKSKKHLALVEKSRREAESLAIQATPSFVINGVLLQGAQPIERFKDKIDAVLKKK